MRGIPILSFLLLLTFSATAAIAADEDICSPMRLDAPDGPMEHMPILDQDDFGSCYAYTAAQLVDAYRFSHGDKNTSHLTSPIEATVDYSFESDTEALDGPRGKGGYSGKALLALIEHGSCDKRVTDALVGNRSEHDFYAALSKAFEDNLQYENSKSVWADIRDLFLRKPSAGAIQAECFLQNSALPRELLPTTHALEKLMNDHGLNFSWFVSDLLHKFCGGHQISLAQVPEPWVRNISSDTPPGDRALITFDAVSKILDAKPAQPVGVGFCATVLADRDYQGLGPDGDRRPCREHAALIIGRRRNPKTGACEYLLRNSWGTGCELYKHLKSWDCEQGTGQIWINALSLGASTYQLTALADGG